jgi:hypothetical protein
MVENSREGFVDVFENIFVSPLDVDLSILSAADDPVPKDNLVFGL